jgi:hypothetical protein
MKSSISWDIMPWSPFKINRRFAGIYLLFLQSRILNQETCLIFLLNLFFRKEDTCSSETSVDFQGTRQLTFIKTQLFLQWLLVCEGRSSLQYPLCRVKCEQQKVVKLYLCLETLRRDLFLFLLVCKHPK